MVIDTELTPELRAEGDARELQRAVQDLRRDAGLELDDRIDLWVDGLAPVVAAHLDGVLRETLADPGRWRGPGRCDRARHGGARERRRDHRLAPPRRRRVGS